jgi:branched-chain amino acid transport system permease protein
MKRNSIAVALVAACLAILPFAVMNDFYIGLASQILIYALFALSINLLVGFGGMVSLGHAVYLGITAYACVLLVDRAGLDQFSAAIASLLIATLTAAGFGVLALRAAGLGFLMITLALGQIVWGVAYRWVDITGGDNGLGLSHRPAPFGLDLSNPTSFYYFTLVVFAVSTFCIWRLAHSPFGASLMGTRDQPRRMSMLGHHVWMIRWVTFGLAGFWAAVPGLLFIYYHKFVSPYVVSLQQSAEGLLMAILGGASTFAGPVVGAVIITLVKNVASTYVERWNALLGAIFVLVVLFMPRGIVPGVQEWWRRLPGRHVEPVSGASTDKKRMARPVS